jgi:hypothetical protein
VPWPVYSERFLYGTGVGQTAILEVPEKRRILVLGIAYAGVAEQGGQIWLKAHGIYTWFSFLPASGEGFFQPLRLVLYERETLRVDTYVTSIGFHVSGHMFADEEGNPPWAPAGSFKDPDQPPPPYQEG